LSLGTLAGKEAHAAYERGEYKNAVKDNPSAAGRRSGQPFKNATHEILCCCVTCGSEIWCPGCPVTVNGKDPEELKEEDVPLSISFDSGDHHLNLKCEAASTRIQVQPRISMLRKKSAQGESYTLTKKGYSITIKEIAKL